MSEENQNFDPERVVVQAPATGEPRVDEVIRRLDRLADLPVEGHVEVFERVHDQLREVLGELGETPDQRK
jgi:hypothetical protein